MKTHRKRIWREIKIQMGCLPDDIDMFHSEKNLVYVHISAALMFAEQLHGHPFYEGGSWAFRTLVGSFPEILKTEL